MLKERKKRKRTLKIQGISKHLSLWVICVFSTKTGFGTSGW